LKKKHANLHDLTARKGWLKLLPDSLRTSIVQKETDHYYSTVTKLDFNAQNEAEKAGLYLSNGAQTVIVRLYSGYENGKNL
jgi:hypothetical protein